MTAMNSSDNLAQEPEQQARRRRILFAALQPFMKRDALYQALWEWEEQHARQPTASLHRFIAALCSAPPLTARRNDVNRNLVMVMQPGDAALGPDPMHEMLAHRRRVNGTPQPGGSSPVAERSPANVVLETIVAGLNGRLARHGPQVYPSYTGYVLENLSMLRLPLSAEVAVACYEGQQRNPVLIARAHWAEAAAAAEGDSGARGFLRSHPGLVTTVECGDVGRPADLDTPADLTRIADLIAGPGSVVNQG